jgi:hypothetical protein
MHRARLPGIVLVVALLSTVVFPSIAAGEEDLPRLDERTALMLGADRLKIGLLSIDYGIVERLSVGTDPPAWAARAFLPVLVPNLHLKFSVLQRGPVSLALKGAGYFVALKDEGSASGTLTAFPLSLFASFRLQPRVWLHTEGTFNWVRAWGAGQLSDSGLGGQVAAQAAQVGTILEVRLTRIFSVTAMGRYQPYTGTLVFEGTGRLDPYTTVDVNGTAEPRIAHPWQAVAGVAVLWRHVHLILGAGYGYYFVPGMDIAYPKRTFVPDASLSVVL